MARAGSEADGSRAAAGFTPDEVAALRELLVRSQIEEIIHRYFRAIDRRDEALMEDVFSPDARMVGYFFDGAEIETVGRDAIIEGQRRMADWLMSHHGARNISVDVNGDRATANTYAVDALIDVRKRQDLVTGPQLLQHGLRYVDTLEHRPEGWRITDRRLYALWQVVTHNPVVRESIPMPR